MALAAVSLAWLVVLALIVSRRIFVSHDTISNYSHVWYVAREIWHHQNLPFHMPVIGHGQAYAFPYGFLPWFVGAVLYPLLGDWGVTFLIVVGAVTLITSTFVAFPELRSGFGPVVVLLNPSVIGAVVIGQLPYLWAASLLMFAIAAWRRDRVVLAIVLAAVAQLTHAAMVMPITAILVAGYLPFTTRRKELVRAYLISAVIAIPGAIMVWISPVFAEASAATRTIAFGETLLERIMVFAVPLLALALLRLPRARLALGVLAVAMVAWQLVFFNISSEVSGLRLVFADRKSSVPELTRSGDLRPGRTYRVLANDHKVAMYEALRNGARLDSEFFPESINPRRWKSVHDYRSFLEERGIESIVLFRSYGGPDGRNERALLRRITLAPGDACTPGLPYATTTQRRRSYDLVAIRRCGLDGHVAA